MKTFLIYGCGKSGVAALNLIWNKKDVFYLFDRDIKKQKEMYEKYKDKHNVFVLKRIENTLIDNLSLIVISPSVSIYNKKILYAKNSPPKNDGLKLYLEIIRREDISCRCRLQALLPFPCLLQSQQRSGR